MLGMIQKTAHHANSVTDGRHVFAHCAQSVEWSVSLGTYTWTTNYKKTARRDCKTLKRHAFQCSAPHQASMLCRAWVWWPSAELAERFIFPRTGRLDAPVSWPLLENFSHLFKCTGARSNSQIACAVARSTCEAHCCNHFKTQACLA
jgi:hypothetical protein